MTIYDVRTRQNLQDFKFYHTISISYWENNIHQLIRNSWIYTCTFDDASPRQYWMIALSE